VRTAAIALLLLAASAAFAADSALTVGYWAVRAESNGGTEKRFDAGLSEVMGTLADLPFTYFSLVKSGQLSAPIGGRAEVELNDRYLFFIEPQSRDEEDRTRARLCIEMRDAQDKDRLVKAVDSRVVLAPGNPVRLGGLKLDGADLILVIKAR